MRFWDKTTIAFRSIINNKSRSILTVIIIFIVTTLIMAILMIALNFANNSYKISEESIRRGYSSINFYRYEKESSHNNEGSLFTKNEILDVVNIIDEKPYLVTEITFDNYRTNTNFTPYDNRKMTIQEYKSYNNLFVSINQSITSFSIPFGVENSVVEGRVWSKDDVNTNHIWVTDIFVQKVFEYGFTIGVGSKIWLHNRVHDYYESPYEHYFSLEYEIKGIISVDSIAAHNKMLRESYPGSYYSKNTYTDIYCDVSYLANLNEAFLYFNQFSITYLPPTTPYNFNQLYEGIENMVDGFEIATKTTGSIKTSIYSTIIEEFKIIKIINAFIIGLAIGLGMFVLFLSIGSVANTIIISVDKNKKFIGLTKALGLKQNEVEDIVRIEATITIIFGVLLSTIGVILAIPLFHSLNSTLINSTFSYQLKELDYTIITQLPFYLPIGVAIIFVIMTLLFSKGSLRTISKMDVITIISEVS